jgi:hypothetical protein
MRFSQIPLAEDRYSFTSVVVWYSDFVYTQLGVGFLCRPSGSVDLLWNRFACFVLFLVGFGFYNLMFCHKVSASPANL